MNPPALRALIRRILLPIFLVSALAGIGGLYLLLWRRRSCLPRHARSVNTLRRISCRN